MGSTAELFCQRQHIGHMHVRLWREREKLLTGASDEGCLQASPFCASDIPTVCGHEHARSQIHLHLAHRPLVNRPMWLVSANAFDTELPLETVRQPSMLKL